MNKITRIFSWSIIVALGGFLFGFDTAVISGVEKPIQQVFKLSPFWDGLTISSALIGTIFGALIAGRPADKYGRKPILFVIAFLFFISALGSTFSNGVSFFILFRFVGGVGVGASSVVAPIYISEISPEKIGGRITALFQLNVIFGILSAFISNYLLRKTGNDPWRLILGVEAVPSVLYFVLLLFVPESPRYLIKIGDVINAKIILNKITLGIVNEEIGKIQINFRRSIVRNKRLYSKYHIKPLSIAFLVAMFNQFSGINAILYYAPRMFKLAGFSSNESMFQPIIIGLTNALFTVVGLLIIDKYGRNILLIFGSIGMSISMGLIALIFFISENIGYELLALLIIYIMFFAFSTGPVIWVLISEIFPNSIRGKGQSFGGATHCFFAALITFLFPVIAENSEMGVGYSFTFFSFMMAVQVFVVWKYFPETKGRSLEEIDYKFINY